MKILVVYPDAARASAVAEACRVQGMSCDVAGGGLYALTWLERNRVDLIVSAADLGDMSGLDLIDIVREDGALASSRFLLIDEAAEQWLTHPNDSVLPESSSAEEIAAKVAKTLCPPPPAAPPPEVPKRLSKGRQHMTGTFEIITLFDLLVSLSQAGRTSKLHVWLSGREACIYLQRGNVVHAEFGPYSGREAFNHIFMHNEQSSTTQFMVEGLDDIGLNPTIHESVSQLLLEVAVELDHVRNNKLGV